MKLLAVMEASSVTGPAKNLIDFARLARKLPEDERIETSVVTFEREGSTSPNAFLEALSEAEIPARAIRQRSAADRSAIAGLREAVDAFAPDLLQTHAVKSHFLMRLSGLGREHPWIAFHHGYTSTDLKMRLYNQLDRWSLRAPAQILTVSLAFEAQLRAQGIPGRRITVLHNAIDPEWMSGAAADSGLRESLGIAPGERVILTVGRLSHEKAHVDLVAALAHVRAIKPDLAARVIIVGEGPERARIEAKARELGLSQSVTLAGFASDPRPYYALADVVALSSLSEGSPNALLEAMAAGIPVVATAAGGIPEIVRHEESALLVPSRQPEALGAALARALTEPEEARRRAAAARSVIENRHSPRARLRALTDIYRGVLTHAHRH